MLLDVIFDFFLYSGLLFTETRKPVLEDDDRELTAAQSFKAFSYWNLDRNPSEGDNLYQAMTWIKIAKAVCNFIISYYLNA